LRNFTLRTKLIATLTTLLLSAFIITNIINYQVSKKSLHTNLVEENLPLISNNIYSQIQKDLMRPIHISSLMANDTFVKEWITSGEKDVSKIQEYLLEIRDQYGFVSTFLVSDKTRHYYHFNGIHKTISEQDNHDVWYYDFKKLNVNYALDIDTDEAYNNHLTIFINHRLHDANGNLLGVTGVGLSMTQIGELLASYQGRFERNIYLVNTNGIVQIHQDLSLIENMNVFDDPTIEQLARSIQGKNENVTATEFDREDKHILLSIRYIPEFDWFLFVEQNETSTLSHLRENLFRNLLFGFVMSVLIIIINIITVNYFQRKLVRMATIDSLTGINNREHFINLCELEFKRSMRYGKPLSVVMIDIDFFKSINDSYGHAIGDRVLAKFADICQQNLRTSDIFGRVGGEEFGAILLETSIEKAYDVTNRLRQTIEKTEIIVEKKKIQFTISIGLTSSKKEDASFDRALNRADEALYMAKNGGRNRIESI
jgi:diguanylate cyclase (GGDEF)-like protein